MRGIRRIALAVLLLLAGSLPLAAQKQAGKDSVFRLIQADRAEQYDQFGMQYRLVKGHARFLHNDTYLLCDSASWNVDAKFIEAFGNVQLIQNKTMLKSEEMQYWIDQSRAQFRGQVVELIDKDGNTLRTDRLTYNTKDSVAVFEYGGALKDKDGNIIEGRKGTYDGKEGMFSFEDRTELFLDSIEIKTRSMRYFTEDERAYFGQDTYVWRGNGFLRADGGWYDRARQLVYFSDHVFMFDPSYDAWADQVYYDQATGAVDMYQNAQVLDTVNKTAYLGDHLRYLPATDSTVQRGILTDDPAVVYFGENEEHVVDTLYARADSFFVFALPRCDVAKEEVSAAEKRRDDIHYDALLVKRTEEAEAREKERIQKMRDVGLLPPEWVEEKRKAEADSIAAAARRDSLIAAGFPLDSLGNPIVPDTTATPPGKIPDQVRDDDATSVLPGSSAVMPGSTRHLPDSTAAALDSLAARDTTPIRHLMAWHNVKLYRSDLQAACDSLVFTELDSIARLYGRPVLWNEVRNQLTSQEMQLLMENGAVTRGSMLTDAWLISQQDSVHYNQIKSTEMLGYFRDNKIYRFDALGGVSAIFYMADEEIITTVNIKESRSLTAALKDGQAQRLLYMESIKSDVYPVGEVEPEKQRLKGFEWRGDERPASREAVTAREVRSSERAQYANIRPPLFRETNKYFDDYMNKLIEKREEERRAEAVRKQAEKDSLDRLAYLAEVEAKAVADSLAAARAGEMPGKVGEIPDQVRDDDSTSVMPGLDSSAVVPGSSAVMPGLTRHLSDSTSVMPGLDSSAVMPGLPRHLSDSTVAAKENVVLPPTDPMRPARPVRDTAKAVEIPGKVGEIPDQVRDDVGVRDGVGVVPASPETVVQTDKLTRAEKRALRRAERKARREARRAERLARRNARKIAKQIRYETDTE